MLISNNNLPVELLIMHHGQDKMDHVLGRNGPRFRDVTGHFRIPSVLRGGGEEGGTSSCDLYVYDHPTTIPVSAVFFLLFSIGGKKVYEPFSLSLSHTHTHTHTYKCNLSYFPYITYNVRLNAIQNIRVQHDKNHHNTKNTAKTCRLQFIFFFFSNL